MFRSGKWILPVFVFTICILASCSSLKFVPEDQYLLKKTTIQSEDSVFDGRTLYPYVHQRPNTKWFSVFKVPLSLYSLSGRDSTVWMNRFLRRLGEPPVVYDSIESNRTLHDMTSAMQSKGYLNAEVSRTTTSKKRRAHVNYTVRPGHLYTIGMWYMRARILRWRSFFILTTLIAAVLKPVWISQAKISITSESE